MLDKTTVAPVTEAKYVPISILRSGDDAPGGSINVRKTPVSKEDDEATKASIAEQGIIQSLCAFRFVGDDHLYVGAGNRRLRLANELVAEGKGDKVTLVPAIIYTGCTPAEARSISLAENVARAPLHPVDRFEAFKQHVDDGMSEADIAARYAMPKKAVKQALALGALSPKVRGLWRDGKIDAQTAQAFTLAPSHERQDEVLAAQKGRPWAHSVKTAILGEQRDVSGALKFVGKKAYEAAGGAIIEDLFEGSKHVSDPALLNTMANNKLSEECDRLTSKEGWCWALTANDAGNERYSWRRVHAEPAFTKEQKARIAALQKLAEDDEAAGKYEKIDDYNEEIETITEAAGAAAFTAEQKAKAGCIVSLDHQGVMKIEAGYVRPTDNGKVTANDMTPAERAKAKKKKDGGGVSEALTNRLTETLTEATGAALTKDPRTALSALLAGIATFSGSPVRVSSFGMSRFKEGRLTKSGSFETVFDRVLDMSDKERNGMLTALVADALDMRLFTQQREQITPKAVAALVNAVPGLNAELRRRFNAKDYFEGVNKTLCLKAIEEAVNKDEARKLASKPKGEVAKFAVTNVPKTGWLPEALRTSHYDGPGSRAKAVKKPAKRRAA